MVLTSKGRNNFLVLPLAFEWSRAYCETGRAQRLAGHICRPILSQPTSSLSFLPLTAILKGFL